MPKPRIIAVDKSKIENAKRREQQPRLVNELVGCVQLNIPLTTLASCVTLLLIYHHIPGVKAANNHAELSLTHDAESQQAQTNLFSLFHNVSSSRPAVKQHSITYEATWSVDAIFTAIEKENIKFIAKQLRENRIKINEIVTTNSRTLLGLAIKHKKKALITYLLKNGADPNQPVEEDLYPIHAAVMEYPAAIPMLIDANADTDIRYKDAALIEIAVKRNIAAIEVIAGLDESQRGDIVYNSLLHILKQEYSLGIFKLLEFGVLPADRHRIYFAWEKAKKVYPNEIISKDHLEDLIKAHDPIHIAVRQRFRDNYVYQGNKLLLHASLRYAAIDDDAEFIERNLRFLASNEALFDVHESAYLTILPMCVKYNALNAVQMLIQHGYNVNIKDPLGFPALHYAATYAKPSMIKLLLKVGALIEQTDTNEKSTALHAAIRHKENVEVLLDHGANINALTREGNSALHYAAMQNFDVIPTLLERNIDNINHQEIISLRSVLHVLSISGSEKLLAAVLKRGADPNLPDYLDYTPFHYIFVMKKNHPDSVVDLFKKHGADINIRNSNNQTALMRFLLIGNIEVVKALLKAGAGYNEEEMFDCYEKSSIDKKEFTKEDLIKLLNVHAKLRNFKARITREEVIAAEAARVKKLFTSIIITIVTVLTTFFAIFTTRKYRQNKRLNKALEEQVAREQELLLLLNTMIADVGTQPWKAVGHDTFELSLPQFIYTDDELTRIENKLQSSLNAANAVVQCRKKLLVSHPGASKADIIVSFTHSDKARSEDTHKRSVQQREFNRYMHEITPQEKINRIKKDLEALLASFVEIYDNTTLIKKSFLAIAIKHISDKVSCIPKNTKDKELKKIKDKFEARVKLYQDDLTAFSTFKEYIESPDLVKPIQALNTQIAQLDTIDQENNPLFLTALAQARDALDAVKTLLEVPEGLLKKHYEASSMHSRYFSKVLVDVLQTTSTQQVTAAPRNHELVDLTHLVDAVKHDSPPVQAHQPPLIEPPQKVAEVVDKSDSPSDQPLIIAPYLLHEGRLRTKSKPTKSLFEIHFENILQASDNIHRTLASISRLDSSHYVIAINALLYYMIRMMNSYYSLAEITEQPIEKQRSAGVMRHLLVHPVTINKDFVFTRDAIFTTAVEIDIQLHDKLIQLKELNFKDQSCFQSLDRAMKQVDFNELDAFRNPNLRIPTAEVCCEQINQAIADLINFSKQAKTLKDLKANPDLLAAIKMQIVKIGEVYNVFAENYPQFELRNGLSKIRWNIISPPCTVLERCRQLRNQICHATREDHMESIIDIKAKAVFSLLHGLRARPLTITNKSAFLPSSENAARLFHHTTSPIVLPVTMPVRTLGA